MRRALIVAEKPSVADAIASALGGFAKRDRRYEREDLVVTAARGHLVELTVREHRQDTGWSLDALPIIPTRFELAVRDGCVGDFHRLRDLMARADIDEIINACDAGREGELIFRLIYEKAGCRKAIKRMWMQSMVSAAIRRAYTARRPGYQFDSLYAAARSRSEADWIVGINGTRATTVLRSRCTTTSDLATVGRVKTPTLALVVAREKEITDFQPQPFWEIHGTFRVGSEHYTGRWLRQSANNETTGDEQHRCFSKAEAQLILDRCSNQPPTMVEDVSETSERTGPQLFDLTSLQREANKRFKLSAKRTLDIAQSLYERHKATTYPRTDARTLPEDYFETALSVLDSFGATHLAEDAGRVVKNEWACGNKRVFDNAGITDHFAIVPTGQQPASLSQDEAHVYELICRRFLAAFHPPAMFETTERRTVVGSDVFRCTDRRLVEPGWLMVEDTASTDRPSSLCNLASPDSVQNSGMLLKALRTQPPKRYTEDTLLSAMEHAGRALENPDLRAAMKDGIGRPSTRADIIEDLLSTHRGTCEPYMRREGTSLVPTAKAMDLIELYATAKVDVLVSPQLTGQWEQKLSQMELGGYARPTFMRDIAALTTSMICSLRAVASTDPRFMAPSLQTPCPKCAAAVQQGGRAYQCTQCQFRIWAAVAGRPLSLDEVECLLAGNTTSVLAGFTSRKGRTFSAALRLTEDKSSVEFVFSPD